MVIKTEFNNLQWSIILSNFEVSKGGYREPTISY